MNYLQGLTPEQRRAVEHYEGPLLLLAGAGSGKTKTIVARMCHLLNHHRVPGQQILGLTFTNKAAREMKERLTQYLGKQRSSGLFLGTFHALGQRLLQEILPTLGRSKRFAIYDTSDQLSLLREALLYCKAPKSLDRKILLSMISKLKNSGISPGGFAQSNTFDESNPYHLIVDDIYRFYQQQLRRLNAFDFDDLLFETVELLIQHPHLGQQLAQRFRYLFVDEYQDTNELQFRLLKILTGHHHNICVVGDDDQSIYSFRGANHQLILDFPRHFPATTTIKLEQNFRSTEDILTLANKVIAHNKHRFVKQLWTQQQEKSPVQLWKCEDAHHEAQVICDHLKKMHLEHHLDYSSMAVLCRSNGQFAEIEQVLKEEQIPYEVFGGQQFYEKREVKDFIAYLTLLSFPGDDLAFRRICNVPARGIGEQTLEKLAQLAQAQHYSLYGLLSNLYRVESQLPAAGFKALLDFYLLMEELKDLLRQGKLAQLIPEIIQRTEFKKHLEQLYPEAKHRDLKLQDLEFLRRSLERFELREKKLGQQPDAMLFLNQLKLQDQLNREHQEEQGQQEAQQEKRVSLMTLHASKGLEFDLVHLVGVEEELLPHKKADDIEEERRLFYVGITRARKHLVLSYTAQKQAYSQLAARSLSSFLLLEEHPELQIQDYVELTHLSPQQRREHKEQAFSQLINLLD